MKKIRFGLLLLIMFSMVGLLTAICRNTTVLAASDGITSTAVDYENEELVVISSKKVYYAIIKKADVTSVKPDSLIEAALDSGTKYIIDFSTVAANKTGYIGLATSTTADSGGMVNVKLIAINPAAKKVVFKINWAMEGDKAKGYSILSSVEVTSVSGGAIKYAASTTTETATLKKLTNTAIQIQWRKGIYGTWDKLSNLSIAKWKSMCNSGAVLYLRIGADKTQRVSKEYKVKIASSKAPSVKIDVSKMTLAIKNGMEYRKSGETKWTTILPYSAKSTNATAFITGINEYDPNTQNTNKKVALLSITDIVSGSSIAAVSSAGITATSSAVVLEVRTAASTKKPASKTGYVSIPYQSAAPTCTLSVTSGASVIYNVTALNKNAADKTEPATYEYILIAETDIPKLNLAAVKWASLKNSAKLTAKASTKLTLSDGTKKSYVITDSGVVMLVRRKGIAGTTKKAAVLASAYAKVAIPK